MEKQFCENCGKELMGGDFCENCGKKIQHAKNIKDSWYYKNFLYITTFSKNKIKSLSVAKLCLYFVIICTISGLTFVFIENQRSIEKQLEATQSQISTITSSTKKELDQQKQELSQKTNEISKLEADIKASATPNGSSYSMSNVLSTLAPSVVKIVCSSDSSGQNLQEGSGTLYHSSSSEFGPYYVETNLHVVQTSDGSSSDCAFAIYPKYTNANSSIIYGVSKYNIYKTGVDLVFLTPELSTTSDTGTMNELKEYSKNITSSTFCSSSNIGDHVSILGYPGVGGSSLTATAGIVSGYEFDDGVRFIKTSAEIEHGNSGGIAIEDSGCVLGIPTFVDQGEISSIGRILDLYDLFNN